ncbi:MAG TPA: YceI family protein [Streptosporangiaceae bacterium]|jgi:polyisoprenoid-binding protein YceI|nr:YceI family protein [Streptosporangiaceae bacterium]
MSSPQRWLWWVVAGGAAVILLAVGGPFVFFHFVEGSTPAPLSLKSSSATAAAATPSAGGATAGSAGPVAGTWKVSSGSQVGYRVQEILFGQQHTAVGRSSDVTGSMVISGAVVRTASFTVPMSSIHTDSSQRDAQFDGRIMDVAAYPHGTFTLTRPISLDPRPATGTVRTYTATGNLTLHGHTQQVSFTLTAQRTATAIKVAGSIPVTFARWGIPNPSFSGFVTTQNHGLLEFLLTLSKS